MRLLGSGGVLPGFKIDKEHFRERPVKRYKQEMMARQTCLQLGKYMETPGAKF